MPSDKAPSSQRRIEELVFIKIPHYAAGVLFLVAVAINIVNVIGRYVFSKPIFWAEEVLIYVVIWAVFLVAGSVTYKGAHLNMDLLYASMPAGVRRMINLAIAVTLVASAIFTAYEAWQIVALQIRTHGVTAGTDIPLAIPTAALVFGFAFIALAAIVRIRSYISGEFDSGEV
jgi:TRAP-type C4-dicarboxylate transport system permease small subunit